MTKAQGIIFWQMCAQSGMILPCTEFRFDLLRRWRFDYAWLSARVALEVDGAIWTGGRHSRGSGLVKEHEKFNRAAVLGWRILRCQPRELCRAKTIEMIRDALKCP